ncbi:Hint domain-containing protein [Xanthovirga aplysinae]|uniref:Hint domain-containing protein n=1 Tax=Xanthovirga aplysinae TaxID=2529853 RepID=UPI0012BCE2D7|nr:Hint domain-containing protein [Xanthovirga aplysinae]MTI33162.1 hypothetical protein [Xanthovirga aplysinae]
MAVGTENITMRQVANELGLLGDVTVEQLFRAASLSGFDSRHSSRTNLTTKPMKLGEFRGYSHMPTLTFRIRYSSSTESSYTLYPQFDFDMSVNRDITISYNFDNTSYSTTMLKGAVSTNGISKSISRSWNSNTRVYLSVSSSSNFNSSSGSVSYLVPAREPDNCLLAGQRLKVSDTESKLVEEVKVGDRLFTYDVKTNSWGLFAVKNRKISSTNQWYKIITSDKREIKCSPSHHLMVNFQKVEARNLNTFDKLQVFEKGVWTNIEIKSIKAFDETVDIYKIEVDKAHTYFTDNNIFHHNLKLPPDEHLQ